MQAIADLVIVGKDCADIGTDHGYIPAYLLEHDICPNVILCDINDGPLSIAKNNFIDIDKSRADFRLGDGIKVLKPNEVASVIIAGMGGELIEDILGYDIEKSYSFERIILQPRTKSDELRIWLNEHDFTIDNIVLAKEKDRICQIFSVKHEKSLAKENPIISDLLVKSKDPLLDDYINYLIKIRNDLLNNLRNANSDESVKINQIETELNYLQNIR